MTPTNPISATAPDLLDNEPDVRELEHDSPVASLPSEKEDASSTSSHYEIVSIPADFTLEGLALKWKKKQLIIPGFQRKFVWTQRQASRLIESFLLGLPVPALFLYADPDSGEQQVIDGQQRLMSVVQFFDGTFRNAAMNADRLFRLTGLGEGSPYTGCTAKDLEQRFMPQFAKLNDAVMRAFMIKQLDPTDATSIYHIFERLNTGGSRLLGQEIRNCVYHGSLNDLIGRLNKNPEWRRIIGTATADSRMRDIEMILRFVSLYFFSDEYKKPMKDFLSKSMRKKRNLSEIESKQLESTFNATCSVIVEKLGDRPFHKDRGMNPAVFDAVFTAIAGRLGELPPDVAARLKSLMSSNEFKNQSSYRTTDAAEVAGRLKLARKHLFDTK